MPSLGLVQLLLCRVFPKFYLFSRSYFPVYNKMSTQISSSTLFPLENGSFKCFSVSFLNSSSNFSSKSAKASIFNASFSSISNNTLLNQQSESNHSETNQLQEHSTLKPKQKLWGFARFVPPGLRSTTPELSPEPNNSFSSKESVMWRASQSTKKPEPFFVPSSSISQSESLSTSPKSMNSDPLSSLPSLKPTFTSPLPSSSTSSIDSLSSPVSILFLHHTQSHLSPTPSSIPSIQNPINSFNRTSTTLPLSSSSSSSSSNSLSNCTDSSQPEGRFIDGQGKRHFYPIFSSLNLQSLNGLPSSPRGIRAAIPFLFLFVSECLAFPAMIEWCARNRCDSAKRIVVNSAIDSIKVRKEHKEWFGPILPAREKQGICPHCLRCVGSQSCEDYEFRGEGISFVLFE